MNKTRSPYIYLSALLLCIAMFSTVYCAQSKSSDLVLKNANSNSGSFVNGESVIELNGDVIFEYDDMTIRGDHAKWWRTQNVLHFTDNIRIERKKQLLSCNRLVFEKKKTTLSANGNLSFTDSVEHTTISGQSGVYDLAARRFVLRDNPVFAHYDSATAETLTIRGTTMTYSDSTKTAIVDNNVVIHKGDLVARAEHALYFTKLSRAQLRTKPTITYLAHSLVGDSVNLFFNEMKLKSIAVWGKAHAIYKELAQSDSAITDITGDSIYMKISMSGTIDSTWVHGHALSSRHPKMAPDERSEVSGKTMLMSFTDKGDAKVFKVWGNAASTYYISEKGSAGRNKASGDSISVGFKNSKADFLRLAGSVRGIYYPDKVKKK